MVTAAGDQSEAREKKAGDSCTLMSSKLRLLIQISDPRLLFSGAIVGRKGAHTLFTVRRNNEGCRGSEFALQPVHRMCAYPERSKVKQNCNCYF